MVEEFVRVTNISEIQNNFPGPEQEKKLVKLLNVNFMKYYLKHVERKAFFFSNVSKCRKRWYSKNISSSLIMNEEKKLEALVQIKFSTSFFPFPHESVYLLW